MVRALLLAGVVAFPAMTALAQLDLPPLPPELPELKNAIHKPEETGLILKTDKVSDGYTLIATRTINAVHLIDNDGYVVHQWDNDKITAMTAYLLPNGNLLRTVRNSAAEIGNIVQELDWNGEVVWEYSTDPTTQLIHHDVERLPNGNTLLTVWERKESNEYVAAGRNPEYVSGTQLWVDAIYEVKPTGKNTGEVVWRWSSWDHVIQDFDPTKANYGDPKKHPELLDLNQYRGNTPTSDFLHINAVSYNPERDEILLSSHTFSEVFVISRKTGELVYRYGNPQRYGKAGEEDRTLFSQHDPNWIGAGLRGAGNILVFNNQNPPPRGYAMNSSVLELKPPLTADGTWPSVTAEGIYPPCEVVWEYTGGTDESRFYSSNLSSAQRLPGGGTLIGVGMMGRVIELDADGNRVWEYIDPIFPIGPQLARLEEWNTLPEGAENTIFRAYKYAPDYPAFAGKDLSSKMLLKDFDVRNDASQPAAP